MRIRFNCPQRSVSSIIHPEIYSIVSGVAMIGVAFVAFAFIGISHENQQSTQPQERPLPPAIEVIVSPPKAKSVFIDGVEYVPRDGAENVERQ